MTLDVPKPLFLVLSAALQAIALFSHGGLTSIFVVFLVLNVFAHTIYVVFIYLNFVSPIRHFPTPKVRHGPPDDAFAPRTKVLQTYGALPLLGHFLTGLEANRGEELLRCSLETPNDGLIRLRGLFNSDQLLITSHKAQAEVLVTKPYEFPKPERSREFLRTGLGDGMVVAECEYHKHQRKHAMPSFSFWQIKDLYPLSWNKAMKMAKVIDDEVFSQRESSANAEGKLVGLTDIDRWAPKATLDIIGVAGLGRDFNTLENSDDPIAKLYADLFMPSLGTRMEFRTRKKECIKRVEDASVDTLAALIKIDVFSDNELVDQLLTILVAGHETTSSSFTWITYLLSLHPDIQSRVRAEIHAALPSGFAPGRSPDSDIAAIFESLPLLSGVCLETLRLFPPVPSTLRQSTKDNTLLGHPIAAGTVLTLAPWVSNNSPALWGPDVHEIKPDRGIDCETGKPNQTGGVSTNYAFMTFLHGPRSCIGQQFAKAELRALVAAFVGMFEWTLADQNKKIEPAIVITVKPKDGLNLRLTKIRDG
ncbi:uncharacterized protein A1O5_11010 [Cladophialophora psammophila CBS 110553]|uniref:Cytochrome P450 oxidoreductase n=1 Tax=Cladophialophora psammophila CBS 110553 TaxID=1182543 RepID=W9X5Q2_9EURO|nr:uncharacterized protein A1O5_11010 [Cladophialophora psammophila CBS 110553]EXJ65769.1 hypothetical protein A1O5_11010 [Cladophialophora psammophila CBS 110553]